MIDWQKVRVLSRQWSSAKEIELPLAGFLHEALIEGYSVQQIATNSNLSVKDVEYLLSLSTLSKSQAENVQLSMRVGAIETAERIRLSGEIGLAPDDPNLEKAKAWKPYKEPLLQFYTETELRRIKQSGGSLVLPVGSERKYGILPLDPMPTFLCNAERPYEVTSFGEIVPTFGPSLSKRMPVTVVDKKDGWLYETRGFKVIEKRIEDFLLSFPRTESPVRVIEPLSGGFLSWALISPTWLSYLFERAPKMEIVPVLENIWRHAEEATAYSFAWYGEPVVSAKAVPSLGAYAPYKFELHSYKTETGLEMFLGTVTKRGESL